MFILIFFSCPLTNVGVNLHNLLNAVGLHQGRGDPLLHSQTHPLCCLDTDGCGAQLEEQWCMSFRRAMCLQVEVYNPTQRWAVMWVMILTLMASMAYSTWNNLPSGENVFTPLQNSHRLYLLLIYYSNTAQQCNQTKK